MGVVIEICVKYPGSPTRNKGTDISKVIIANARDYPHVLLSKGLQ
jgi:hypothetical protein